MADPIPQNQQQQPPPQNQQAQPVPGVTQNQAAPPPKADTPPKGTIYDDLGIDDPAKGAAPGVWSPTWREELATGDDGKIDDKQLARLKRFDSPKAWHKSNMAAEQRIRSGEYKRANPLPADADEATVAKWREENGLPVKPEEYTIAPEGVDVAKLGDAEKATISTFQGIFHKGNLTPDQAKAVSTGVFELAQQQMAAQAEADADHYDAIDDHLRATWGPEFKANLKMNEAHLRTVFGDDAGSVLEARMPNGMKLGNHPGFSEALNKWARAEGGDVLYEGGIRVLAGGRCSNLNRKM